MTVEELREHCLKTLKQTEKFPTKTFEEHALVLQLIENQESTISRLEKIKEEINEYLIASFADDEDFRWFNLCLDTHIKELKNE